MTNKLSELSKPVATVDVQRGRNDGNMFAVAWSSAGHALPDGPHFLYSQEYVSAPPAPAVPEEMTGSIAMTQYRIKPSNYKQWVKGYNACRAAMLAQPVNGGYKLPADWRLDESTGAKILMYKDCSVIEDQQAEYVLSLIRSATAAPDAVDIFADQVIGTKTKIIHMPAPLNVPQEGIRVYLNADELFMQLENQGYIVEVSNE